MDSAQNTLAGGLPHSEIPGSPIARISPGLFAACHVLHRLSVPRHPPNALKRLIRSSSAAHREQTPHATAAKPRLVTLSTHSITRLAVNPRSLSPQARAQDPAIQANSQSHSYPQCQRAGIRDRVSGIRTTDRLARPIHVPRKRPEHPPKRLVEPTGIEPVTPCLQSRCSPS